VLAETIRDWCGRPDTDLTVTGVVDLTEHVGVDRYEAGDRLQERVRLWQTACVFPWCTRPARECDSPGPESSPAATTSSRTPTAAPPATATSRRYVGGITA
jgi:hypothetical protein